MSSYAYFVQTCREEHKKKHPDVSVNFAEFSKKCSERWKVSCRMLSFCWLILLLENWMFLFSIDYVSKRERKIWRPGETRQSALWEGNEELHSPQGPQEEAI